MSFPAASSFVSTAALAADARDATFFGRVDLSQALRPEVINARPVQVAHSPPGSAPAAATYLHVRPGEERRWAAHCKAYGACGLPVYFVRESWYRDVYLPLVGGSDGREQRYREYVRVERNERDGHHGYED
jgi:hypothetical protein